MVNFAAMATPFLLGQVSFFNLKRGFGRLRSEAHPEGVFVHFSAIAGPSRVLIPHELVQYEVRITPRGPRAERVHRLSPREAGRLVYLQEGEGEIRSIPGGQPYTFAVDDWLRDESYPPEAGAAVEFSLFDQQAKEVVITDPRPALARFAQLALWPMMIARLEQTLLPESWESAAQGEGGSRLTAYLFGTFQRLQDENKIALARDEAGHALAAFHTGLHQRDGQAIIALFIENQQPYAHKSYLPRPRWQLSGLVPASHPQLQPFEYTPSRAYYHASPLALVFDPGLPVEVSVDDLLGRYIERFPEVFQQQCPGKQQQRLQAALTEMQWQVQRNPSLAQPIYYRDRLRLVLPLRLGDPAEALVGLLLTREARTYLGQEVIDAETAWRTARLIAPPAYPWGADDAGYPFARASHTARSLSQL